MGILDLLIQRNEAPVLFIGSGISRRYLKDFPDWKQLLLRLWDRLGRSEEEFYNRMLDISSALQGDAGDAALVDFLTNTQIASEIKSEFDQNFIEGKIQVANFSAKEAYHSKISPFKKEISNYVENSSIIDGMEAEIEQFKALLLKARAIITTNYDQLIESLIGTELDVFIKQTDLFLSQIDYGELYKVHGCITSPEDIVITADDYKRFNQNSALISAKLMSFLMESPIIFLGYSLSDQNIASILHRFTESLHSDQKPILQERIIYVNYKSGEENLIEYRKESSVIGAQFTVIETDNYGHIYSTLAKINQGVPVAYVRQFKHAIKKLIVERGKKGTLKALLLSVDNDEVGNDQKVIAIGDNTVIFNLPNRLDYLKDYMQNEPTIASTVALKFIASQSTNTRIPIYKHIKSIDLTECSLRPDELLKIQQRIERQKNITKCMESINNSHRRYYRTIEDILRSGERDYKIYDMISYNIKHLDLQKVEDYAKSVLDHIQYGEWKDQMTYLSRLVVVWDYYKNQ